MLLLNRPGKAAWGVQFQVRGSYLKPLLGKLGYQSEIEGFTRGQNLLKNGFVVPILDDSLGYGWRSLRSQSTANPG